VAVKVSVPVPFCVIIKFPVASAVVAFLVPVSVTVAKGTGFPESSFTVPEIVRLCENANTPLSISTVKSERNFLICLIDLKMVESLKFQFINEIIQFPELGDI
jgi:hypothetical protein